MRDARQRRLRARLEEASPRWLSLDVFDTLLLRPFRRPVDVFVEVHAALLRAGNVPNVGAAAFAKLPREAERASRAKRADREVRIEEIAAELSRALGGRVSVDALVDAEVATESAFIELDTDVAALVRAAAERGVPYVLVSDMYLREPHVRRL